MSANDDLADAATRHAVFLQRYGGSTARRIVGILAEADRINVPSV